MWADGCYHGTSPGERQSAEPVIEDQTAEYDASVEHCTFAACYWKR